MLWKQETFFLPVCVLPDLNENNTGVEPVENEEGKRDS